MSKLQDAYEITKLFKAGDNDKAWKQLTDVFWEIVEDICDAIVKNGKKLIWSGSYYNAKINDLNLEQALKSTDWLFITAALDIKDGIIETGKALGEAYMATDDAMTNEQQISYCATSMLAAYKASVPIEVDLMCRLEEAMVKAGHDISVESMYDAVYSEDILSLSDLLYIADCIMLQTEYDINGYNWLIQLLQQHESTLFKSSFMRNMYWQLPDFWSDRITVDKTVSEYNAIVSYSRKWKSGWKEGFRDLCN